MNSDKKNRITILHDSFGKPSPPRKEWGSAALSETFGDKYMFAGLGESIALPS